MSYSPVRLNSSNTATNQLAQGQSLSTTSNTAVLDAQRLPQAPPTLQSSVQTTPTLQNSSFQQLQTPNFGSTSTLQFPESQHPQQVLLEKPRPQPLRVEAKPMDLETTSTTASNLNNSTTSNPALKRKLEVPSTDRPAQMLRMTPTNTSSPVSTSTSNSYELNGWNQTVPRVPGKEITVFAPQLQITQVALASLSGTHASVGKDFTDGKSVEQTVRDLVENPNLVNTEPNFRLTVFRSTKPGDPSGQPQLWSMNNRRLHAFQEADRQLQQQGRSLPPIQIQWASLENVQYAIQPGKFDNVGGEVGFHNSTTNTQRFLTKSNLVSSTTNEDNTSSVKQQRPFRPSQSSRHKSVSRDVTDNASVKKNVPDIDELIKTFQTSTDKKKMQAAKSKLEKITLDTSLSDEARDKATKALYGF